MKEVLWGYDFNPRDRFSPKRAAMTQLGGQGRPLIFGVSIAIILFLTLPTTNNPGRVIQMEAHDLCVGGGGVAS